MAYEYITKLMHSESIEAQTDLTNSHFKKIFFKPVNAFLHDIDNHLSNNSNYSSLARSKKITGFVSSFGGAACVFLGNFAGILGNLLPR